MKRLIILPLLILSLTACCQTDQTFNKPIYANAGIYFLDGTFLNTASGSGSVTWESILNKPSTFPPSAHEHPYKPLSYVPSWAEIIGKPSTFAPSAHTHLWTEITNKPTEIELINEIPQMAYLPLPQKTTAEINATVIPAGTIAMIWDKTLGVIKIWDGTKWKIIITNN